MVIYCVNQLIQYKKSLVKHLLTKKAGEGTMSLTRIGLIVVFLVTARDINQRRRGLNSRVAGG